MSLTSFVQNGSIWKFLDREKVEEYLREWSVPTAPIYASKNDLATVGLACRYMFPYIQGGWEVLKKHPAINPKTRPQLTGANLFIEVCRRDQNTRGKRLVVDNPSQTMLLIDQAYINMQEMIDSKKETIIIFCGHCLSTSIIDKMTLSLNCPQCGNPRTRIQSWNKRLEGHISMDVVPPLAHLIGGADAPCLLETYSEVVGISTRYCVRATAEHIAQAIGYNMLGMNVDRFLIFYVRQQKIVEVNMKIASTFITRDLKDYLVPEYDDEPEEIWYQ